MRRQQKSKHMISLYSFYELHQPDELHESLPWVVLFKTLLLISFLNIEGIRKTLESKDCTM